MLVALRFVALLATALLMSLTWAHVWQLPPRMDYDGVFWFETLSMYREFGPEGAGPAVEIAALLAVGALALLERSRTLRAGARIAFLCLAASFAAWWLGVRPVNVVMTDWNAAALPSDWTWYRMRWEHTHAARALAVALGFAALVLSLLVDAERARPSVVRSH
jgi:hypothetical protein